MRTDIKWVQLTNGNMKIGYEPAVYIPEGLVVEYGEAEYEGGKISYQPAFRCDLHPGVTEYPFPPIDPEEIGDVYIEVQGE